MTLAPDDRTPATLLAAVCAVFVWSLIGCHDLFTWFLETVPAMIAIPALIWLYPRLRFTNLVYTLIAIHASILMVGGHYTYSEMPVFNWIKDAFHLDRNYYDRLGHFAQGFVPAMILREVLLRTTPLRPASCWWRWSWASAWGLARCTSCSNLQPPKSRGPRPTLFWAARGIRGIPSGI